MASPQEAVMKYLEENEEITNRIGREITAIRSENVMKDVFLSLKKTKMLEPVPGKKGNASAWRKYTGYWEDLPQEQQDEAEEQLDFIDGVDSTGGN